MEIKHLLQQIKDYYSFAIGVGHTRTILHGILNNDRKVIFVIGDGTQSTMKSCVNNNHPKGNPEITTISTLSGTLNKNYNRPLVFDNLALEYLFGEAIKKIERLEIKLVKVREMGEAL